ncbi:MAG: roadblock/LC7 domain-containing protein [Promethearchaeia archaeon]
MSFPDTEKIDEHLRYLNQINGVVGSALVEYNGILISSELPRSFNKREMSAMSATMFGATEKAIENIGEPTIFKIIVDLNGETCLVVNAEEYLFLVMIKRDANMGLILIEIEEIINKLK